MLSKQDIFCLLHICLLLHQYCNILKNGIEEENGSKSSELETKAHVDIPVVCYLALLME